MAVSPHHTTQASVAPPSIDSEHLSADQLGALAARVVSDGDATFEIEQPFTGGLLGTVPRCGTGDIERAADRARAAQEQWARTDFGERRRILLRFHDLLLDRREEILDLI